MPATAAINTPARQGKTVLLALAANAVIFQGTQVARNAAGFAVPAADAANLKVQGIAQETVDNTGGANGAKSVNVEKGVYGLANSATDPVSVADLGNTVYIEDDATIRKATGVNSVKAGKLIDLSDGKVWVDNDFATP